MKTFIHHRHWVLQTVLFAIAVILLLPILLTLLYSFFSPAEIRSHLLLRGSLDKNTWMPILLRPQVVSVAQYYRVLLEDSGILQRFLCSCFYAFAILLGQAMFVPSLAYSLSAFRFRGRSVIFFLLILLMLLPFQVTMVPNILMLRTMNLLDTVGAVILPMWFSPFYIFLIRQYMVGIPHELYEAAQLDGAGTIYCYTHIALPASKPVIGAAAALSFADIWNMVEQPMTFLTTRDDLQPLSTIFNQLIDNPSGMEFAGAVLYMLPALFVYLFFQEDIVTGIQLTDLK